MTPTGTTPHPFHRFPYQAAMDPADEEFRRELRAFLAEHPAPGFDRRQDLAGSLRAALAWHGLLARCCGSTGRRSGAAPPPRPIGG
jgi:hypothetical protein